MSRASMRPDLGRRLIYSLYRVMPAWGKRRAIMLFAPKVSLGVCAVIADGDGRVLLVRHTYRSQPWGLPGGLVRHGEQPADALAREVREELGVDVSIGQVLGAYTAPRFHQLTLYYRATLTGAPRHDGIELGGMRYVAPQDIPTLTGRSIHSLLPFMAACEPLGRGIQ